MTQRLKRWEFRREVEKNEGKRRSARSRQLKKTNADTAAKVKEDGEEKFELQPW